MSAASTDSHCWPRLAEMPACSRPPGRGRAAGSARKRGRPPTPASVAWPRRAGSPRCRTPGSPRSRRPRPEHHDVPVPVEGLPGRVHGLTLAASRGTHRRSRRRCRATVGESSRRSRCLADPADPACREPHHRRAGREHCVEHRTWWWVDAKEHEKLRACLENPAGSARNRDRVIATDAGVPRKAARTQVQSRRWRVGIR